MSTQYSLSGISRLVERDKSTISRFFKQNHVSPKEKIGNTYYFTEDALRYAQQYYANRPRTSHKQDTLNNRVSTLEKRVSDIMKFLKIGES